MHNRIITTPSTRLEPGVRASLLACGLWMRAAFIGASAAAMGVIQLFEGEWSASVALTVAAAGVGVTFLSWRRAQAALGGADEPARVTGATPAAAHR